LGLVKEYARRSTDAAHRRIVFRYCVSPTEVIGSHRVEAVRIAANELVGSGGSITAVSTDHTETVETSLLLRSVGFRGRPLPGLPFEERRGLVPNARGRVVGPQGDPIRGVYVAGWIKRGATGTIGTNKHCARETVDSVLEDFTSGRLTVPEADGQSLARLVAARRPTAISKQGWRAIDQAERRRGAEAGRPRTKFTRVDEMVEASKNL
jgi:ferredoxin--NADP+ reductase